MGRGKIHGNGSCHFCYPVVCKDGVVRSVARVELATAEATPVCNLTVRDYHTFAVGENAVLVHNQSWCDIYAGKMGLLTAKTPELLQKLKQVNIERAAKGLPPLADSAIHGHHLVMKNAWDQWSVAARQILLDFDIDGSYTKAALENAEKGDIHNLALAVNGADGIHSEKYAYAVWKRLSDVIALGGGKERIRARLIEAMAEMKKTLEAGGTFW